MKRFVSEEAKQAFRAAIQAVEARSSAEVVVAVRHHSGSYLHADVLVGAVGAFATLAFTLYSEFDFALWSILIDPAIAGILCGLLTTQLPMVRRWLTPASRRQQRVTDAAHAAFHRKGIRLTQDRTGMLVYVSLLERAVQVVADRGVTDAIPPQEWTKATAAIERQLRATGNGVATAQAVAELAELCEPYLEHSEDDVNELPDEVCAP